MLWIVLELEKIEVTTVGSLEKQYAPGEYECVAGVIEADTPEHAIEEYSQGQSGFFIPIPLNPREIDSYQIYESRSVVKPWQLSE